MSRPVPTFTIAELEEQERRAFPSLGNDEAVDLGLVAVAVAREWGLNLAVQVVINGDVVFRARLKSTGSDNDPWLAGKAAVVREFGESSLLVKQRHLAAGTPFDERIDVDHSVFRASGGSIPLRVSGTLVGTLTVSGEPDGLDHAAAAEAVSRYLSALG